MRVPLFPMGPPSDAQKRGARLTGNAMYDYMQDLGGRFVPTGKDSLPRLRLSQCAMLLHLRIGSNHVTYIEAFGATYDFIGLSLHESERAEALLEIAAWMKVQRSTSRNCDCRG